MTVKRFSTLMLTLTALLAGCKTHQQAAPQTMMVPPGSFIQEWTVDPVFKKITATSHATDMIFLHGEENLYAAISKSGSLKFRAHIGNGFDTIGEPMMQGDRLVFPASSGLEIYNLEGTPIKHIPFGQPLRSSGVLLGQTVYVGTDSIQGGRISALALDEPYVIERWTRLAGGTVNTKPVLFENNLFIATESGTVFAMTTDPKLIWPHAPEMKDQIFHTSGKILAPIKVDDTGVYVPSTDTKLYCLDHNTGKIKWEYIAGQVIKNSPQVTADTVYIYIGDRGLVALNKKNEERYAKPRWIAPDAVEVLSEDKNNTYVLTQSGQIAALDKNTGKALYTTGAAHFTQAIENLDPKSNLIYAITASNELVAIRPVNTAGVVGHPVTAGTKDAPHKSASHADKAISYD